MNATPPETSSPETPSSQAAPKDGDLAALAKGGRTNFFGFLLRLAARLPFLFIAGRLYGADALGRFAYAVLVVELAAQLATMGLKRGLAQQLTRGGRPDAHVVADALLLSFIVSAGFAAVLLLLPGLMFPNSAWSETDRLLALLVFPIAGADIALAALAYRFDVASTVRARSIIEPWTISIAAGVLWFVAPTGGLINAYALSMLAAMVAAMVPLLRSYGWPRQWSPQPRALFAIARENLPLAAADAVEWGSRRLDLAILGLFTSPAVVGIYYVAQQVASLPQKLKTSFDPILGPVITRNLKEGRKAEVARHVSQVGFWIIAAQAGIALALGIPGEGVMGLVGPNFVGGTGALAFLLAAEVVAATAVVSEAALVYIARHRNLMISLAMLALQAVLSVGLIKLVAYLGFNPMFQAAAAAAALMLALGAAAIAKARLLGRLLGAPVNSWRWPLVWAAAPAVVVGWLAVQLPEWAELAFGVWAILGVYGYVIWRKGFGPEDRVLFEMGRKKPLAPPPLTSSPPQAD